jgi:isoleucyl-tRNA synthetase
MASPDRAGRPWARVGDTYILAEGAGRGACSRQAKVEGFELVADVSAEELAGITCATRWRGSGYGFDVPLLDGDHVTDDAGTGFVHTAPGPRRATTSRSGWPMAASSAERGIDEHPLYRRPDGRYYQGPPFAGLKVLETEGKKGGKGDANGPVIDALIEAGSLLARGRLKHQYPHSWRSKAPVIFRNTPQWFIRMDRPYATARPCASGLARHRRDAVHPESGENRIRGMVENRPDWLISRQRAWGVPIAVFVDKRDRPAALKDEVGQRPDHRGGGRRRRRLVQGPEGATSSARTTRPATRRSRTSSTSGSIPARPTPSRWNARRTSRTSTGLTARSTGPPTSISRARTSIAAGSSPRCSRAAAPAAARPTTWS